MSIQSARTCFRTGAALCALAALSMPARAGDWYVDASLGSDANTGEAPGAAWRTITHAVATIATLPNAVQTIHVAAGLYDPALGEVFPLRPAPRTRIVGAQGGAPSILEGPASALLVYNPDVSVAVDAQSGADRLTLRNAVAGIVVGAGTGSASPSFHDIRIEGMSDVGVRASASSSGPFGGASASATIERLEVVHCNVGVVAQAFGGGLGSGGAQVNLTDAVIRSSTSDGVRYSASGNAGARANLQRCRVIDNGGHGAYGTVNGGVTSAWLQAEATLFAGNQLCGVFGDGATQGESGQFYLDGCTIADNVDCGVRGLNGNRAHLANSVLARNGDDLDMGPGNTFASFSDCANGDLAGFPGCIAADPQFVDPAARDYRLRFGSPCVDVGDPAFAGALDLAGRARPFDGDLDTVAVPDMGALELAPLALVGVPRIGTTVFLEVTGPAGMPATLYSSRRALLVAPAHTPFGALWLARSSLTVYAQTAAQPGPPGVVPVPLTNDPSWIGRTFSFQARIASPAAPAGSAFSNPVQFTLRP